MSGHGGGHHGGGHGGHHGHAGPAFVGPSWVPALPIDLEWDVLNYVPKLPDPEPAEKVSGVLENLLHPFDTLDRVLHPVEVVPLTDQAQAAIDAIPDGPIPPVGAEPGFRFPGDCTDIRADQFGSYCVDKMGYGHRGPDFKATYTLLGGASGFVTTKEGAITTRTFSEGSGWYENADGTYTSLLPMVDPKIKSAEDEILGLLRLAGKVIVYGGAAVLGLYALSFLPRRR